MYCLDDPKSIEFQGGHALSKEQTFEFQVSACTDSNLDCITDESSVATFLKDKAMLTMLNQNSYKITEYDESPIEQKAIVVQDYIGVSAPVAQTWNIKMSTLTTQDDRWKILPFEDPEHDLIKVYKAESHNAEIKTDDGSRLYAKMTFQLDQDKMEHERSVYRLIDLMGDVGGFLGIL